MLMRKNIILKSGAETLGKIFQGPIDLFTLAIKTLISQFLITSLILLVLSGLSFYLLDIHNNFILLTFLLIFILIAFGFSTLKKVLSFRTQLKNNKYQYEELKKEYKEIDSVLYTLTEDNLLVKSKQEYEIPWSTFTSLENMDDSFWLFNQNVVNNVWIPKATIEDSLDYIFFKEYASKKINVP
jgi:hypothetical protein